jgi:hypothetical protein
MGYEKNGAISTNSDYRHVCSPKSSFFAHSAKLFRTNTFFNRIANLENSIFFGKFVYNNKNYCAKAALMAFLYEEFLIELIEYCMSRYVMDLQRVMTREVLMVANLSR